MHKTLWIAAVTLYLSLSLVAQDQVTAQTKQPTPASSVELAPSSDREGQNTLDEPGHLIKKVLPPYPEKAEDQGVQGPVVLHVAITKKGKVKDVRIVSGDPVLANAAAKAVRHWEYRPFLREGVPADVETDLTINFMLHSLRSIGACPGRDPVLPDKAAPDSPKKTKAALVAPSRVGGGVSAPRVKYDPEPDYTDRARKAKYQGVVVLYVVVGTDGLAHDIRVSRGIGMGLDEKAVEAVCQWKFDPAKKDGQPVPVAINVEVTFHLF